MDNVDNKYRLIKSLNADSIVSSFLAYDVTIAYELMQLNIFRYISTSPQLLHHTIQSLSSEEIEILRIISIFTIPVTIDTLNALIGSSNMEIAISNLKSKGIINEEFPEKEKTYEFYSNALKDYVYNSIEEASRRLLHNIAATLLEDMAKKDRAYYFQELIYHLEKSDSRQKIINCYVSDADILESLKDTHEAIKNLEKAISIYDPNVIDERKIKILLRLGNLNNACNETAPAIRYYKAAEQAAKEKKLHKMCIDALIDMTRIRIVQKELKEAEIAVGRLKQYLKREDYWEGNIETKILEARIKNEQKKYFDARTILLSCIPLFTDENFTIHGRIYLNLGNACLKEAAYKEEALEHYKKAFACFKKSGYKTGCCKALQNMALVLRTLYKKEREALECLMEAKEMCPQNDLRELTYLIFHIAELHFNLGCYSEAISFIHDAIKHTIMLKDIPLMILSYVVLSAIYLRIGNYNEAYRYNQLAESELASQPLSLPYADEYYASIIQFLFEFGGFKKTKHFSAIDINTLDYKGRDLYNSCEIYTIFIQIANSKEADEHTFNKVIEILDRFEHIAEKNYFLIRFCIMLYDLGMKEKINPLLLNVAKLLEPDYGSNSELLLLTSRFIIMVCNNNDKIHNLFELYKEIQLTEYNWLAARAAVEIGDYYFSIGKAKHCLYYYITAFERIEILISHIPPEYRFKMLKTHGLISILEKVLDKTNDYLSIFRKSRGRRHTRITCYDDVLKIYSLEEIKNLLKDREFQLVIRELYSMDDSNDAGDVNSIIENLSTDPIHNLNLICRHLAADSLAARVIITETDADSCKFVIASSNSNKTKPKDMLIFEAVNKNSSTVCFNSMDETICDLCDYYDQYSIKAAMCIPVPSGNFQQISRKPNIIGYIYIESESILNIISNEKKSLYEKLTGLVALNIDKYNFFHK